MVVNHIPPLSRPKYRPDIDGLRAVAVLAVVAFHAFPDWMKGGFIGVDVFFVISGYLISTIIFENLDKGTFSFTEFYTRRIKRIFPALIIVLVSCFAFGWFVLLPDELNQLGKHIAGGAVFVSNLVLWNESGYFDIAADMKPLLHLWSLGIEEQFYIIWPLLLYFAYKKRFNLLSLGVTAALISFCISIYQTKIDSVAAFYSPVTRFWELMLGSILAWLTLYELNVSSVRFDKVGKFLDDTIFSTEHAKSRQIWVNITSLFGLSLLIYGFWQINKDIGFPGIWALIPVLGAAVLIFSGPKAWVNRVILSNKVVVWFGIISFPLYLWHWPLLSFTTIIGDETLKDKIRIAMVALSVVLAWLTVKVIEKPFRFGQQRVALKVSLLCSLIFVMGVLGLIVSKSDFSQSHAYTKLVIQRKSFKYTFDSSLGWIKGKGHWLFLGNASDNTVAKLTLDVVPNTREIESVKEIFSTIAKTGAQFNTKVSLIVAPNKSNIYSEYLPYGLVPSAKKYSSFFLDTLKNIPNLIVYNPTDDFLRLKKTEGILYWMTDTHWNNKGAFLAYSGFAKLLGLPVPEVEFQHSSPYSGDLIKIAHLENFPLHAEDNWDVVWKNAPMWREEKIPNEQKTALGTAVIVNNQHPLSNQYVWVVGDSFTGPLKQYFNSTFREVRYIGHWYTKLNTISGDLVKADKKPDMIIVVRVERSF
ncbi:MAG: acyltransferase family protein [Legionella sp.]|nr:acyltransferase family protein [Legionella sp.]